MATIPEIVLQRAIIAGFRAMRKDTRLIDTIFRNLNQGQLQHVKSFLTETSIDFSVNYPRKEPTLPAMVLLLKSENEASVFLNDMLGDSSNPNVPDVDLSYDTLGGHAASVTGSEGLPRKIGGPLFVESQLDTNTLILAPGQEIFEFDDNILDFSTGCIKLYIVDGAGKGEVYDIFRITDDKIHIIGSFTTTLDSTSVVDIRRADNPMAASGEPSRIYAHDGSYYRKGVNYQTQYQLDILTGHQDETIYLYSITKALLLSQRNFLESQGIINLSISGSDFAPRTEFLPDETFHRVMNLTFESPFTFIEELDTFTKFNLKLWYEDEVIVTSETYEL